MTFVAGNEDTAKGRELSPFLDRSDQHSFRYRGAWSWGSTSKAREMRSVSWPLGIVR